MRHSGWSEDWRGICRGRKVHGYHTVLREYNERVPCAALASFFSFVEPWALLEPGRLFDQSYSMLADFFAAQLPGLSPPDHDALVIYSAAITGSSVGSIVPSWLRLVGSVFDSSGHTLHCEVLALWGFSDEELLLEPGAHPDGFAVRSLTCGEPAAEPLYIWEDAQWSGAHKGRAR